MRLHLALVRVLSLEGQGHGQLILLNFFKKRFYLFILREWGGRGRETSMCGCLLCAPYWGPGLQPRHVPCLGIELATLVCEPALNPLSYTSQSSISFLISKFVSFQNRNSVCLHESSTCSFTYRILYVNILSLLYP